jgi:phage terminase large subunit GpA-like protein
MAGESVRVVVGDEIDRMEDQGEGDPVNLLHRRCAAFPNKIKLTTSTPKYEETSRIWKKFLAGTQHYYYIKSPTTGQYFKLEWENFKINKEHPELSELIDPTCGKPISDEERKNLIYNGEWRKIKDSGIYSFHLNGMYRVTPTSKGHKNAYSEWATEYIAAEKSGELQDFYNTFLALPVKEDSGEKLEHGDYSKYLVDIDFNALDNSIIAISSGTDIQGNRKETYVYGWTEDFKPTLLESIIIDGEPTDEATWIELDKFLQKTYTRQDGKKLLISASFIDSGNWQNTVLNFTENKSYRGIFPVKGATAVDAPLIDKAQNRKRQWMIGTNEAKDLIFSDYVLGRIRFNRAYADDDYFKQLFSETKQYKNGKYSYHKVTQRNESLDTFVYALAAVKRKNFMKFAKSLFVQDNTPPQKEEKIEVKIEKKEPIKPTIYHDPYISDDSNGSISF